jgi:SAM-dependent methyltransferase
MSVADPFFLTVIESVAELVKKSIAKNREVFVCDFGCGTGHTTLILALTGASVFGIENQMSDKEIEKVPKLLEYYDGIAKKIGSERISKLKGMNKFLPGVWRRMENTGLNARIIGVDARLLHEDPRIEKDTFSVCFMGNFLHMFDPATAKEIIKKQVQRMLNIGGSVFASVDGVSSHDDESTKTYLQGVKDGIIFTSVMTATNYGKLSAKGEIGEIDPTAFFTPAKIDETGRTASECRRINTRKWHYCGPDLKSKLEVTSETPTTETFLCAEVNRTVCLYDSSLIDFVFPDSEWNVSVLRKDIYGQYNPDLLDHEVAKWNIIALKK